MKLLLLLVLVASANARIDCEHPNFFQKLLCGVKDAAKTVGSGLLEGLKTVGTKAATELGGTLISGLQNIAKATEGTVSPDKRDLDMGELLKIAEFAGAHRDMIDDLGNVIQNVTHVTLDKIDALAKQFIDNPSEELLGKIMAYLQAHHIIQNNIQQWIEKNGAGLTMMAVKDLLSHKRQTGDLLSQVSQVGSKLAGSFGPLVSTLKGLVTGLGSQLLGFFKNLLPNADQLLDAFKPHLSALQEHGSNLLDTAKGAVDAVKDAVGDILKETMKQSAPHVNGILSHIGSAIQTATGAATTPAP